MKKTFSPMMIAAMAALTLSAVSPRAMAGETAVPLSGDLALDIVGAVRGYVETCGCHSGNYGGIARRATYLQETRKELPTLAVFAGGMRLGTGTTPDIASATLWDALPKMGYDAATVSSEDLVDLAKMPAAARKLLTVGNVTMQDGAPIAPPVLYKSIKDKQGKTVRVAFIGLLGKSPYLTAPNPDNSPNDMPWKVTDPEAALRKAMPDARKNADLVVVLFSGSRDPARALIEAVPGADVMVVGLEGSVDQKVEKVGNTALVQSAERGRFATAVGITLNAEKHPSDFSIRTVALDTVYVDDPGMTKLVEGYRTQKTAAMPPPPAATVIQFPAPAGS
jgi:2',3'-cyclic-nucleotide 2'-phosphodiesterase (5'-nucleotidase family)